MSLISENTLKNKINTILHKYYPIQHKYSFHNLNNLSHFSISFSNFKLFLPFHINIKGNILYKNHISSKTITHIICSNSKIHTWNHYLSLLTSFLPNDQNYCINPSLFLHKLHSYNYIESLHIHSVKIFDSTKNISFIKPIQYQHKQYHSFYNDNLHFTKINKPNHFYFNSFLIQNHKTHLKNELMRLFTFRDSFKNIHFHLNNNHGGQLVPVHLILRYLIGIHKEPWMKNIKQKLSNGKIIKWNPWNEDNENNPNYHNFKDLNLDFIPEYQSKYNGKIYLYMNNYNGSASWYFITYLIYAFSNKIKRFTKICHGKTLKFGSISKNSQLKLYGISSTCSGDSNSTTLHYKNIEINCPTKQFIQSSVKNIDWNRFWCQ